MSAVGIHRGVPARPAGLTGLDRLRIDLQPERAGHAAHGEQEIGSAEQIVSRWIDAIPVGGNDSPIDVVGPWAQPTVGIDTPHVERGFGVHEARYDAPTRR